MFCYHASGLQTWVVCGAEIEEELNAALSDTQDSSTTLSLTWLKHQSGKKTHSDSGLKSLSCSISSV